MLVLRPQPGVTETARRVEALGFDAVVAPLFTIRPIHWEAPDPASVEAVLLTSANAPRHAGDQITGFTSLPCYAVGQATETAARAVGFTRLITGGGDGAAIVRMMIEDGVASALHLCGRDHIPVQHEQIRIDRRSPYASEAVEELPEGARQALERGAVALLHSPRAAALFGRLVDDAGLARDRISVAAISAPASQAAGGGWQANVAAAQPRDDALLELAAKLCQNDGMGTAR